MRRKLAVHAAVLLMAVFAMSANAFCAGLCAGGHGHGNDAHGALADKNGPAPAGSKQGREAHSCHHYASPQANAAPHGGHDRDEKAKPHVCHTGGHEDDGRAVSAKAAKPDKSFPVIECNCMDDPGAFAPETEAPISSCLQPAPALDFVAAAATAEARLVLSEFLPPEQPPRNHTQAS